MGNKNVFEGDVKIGKNAQIAGGDIYNVNVHNSEKDFRDKKPEYTPEPVWRSPFTLAVLSWISVITGILSLLPVGAMIKNSMNGFQSQDARVHLILFVIFEMLFLFFMTLRRIAKKQTRYPLRFNYAISGYGERLTLEKIHTGKCPQCGGKMRYYNKPVEWVDKYYSNGKSKREVTKRCPALECQRNAEHCYWIDPADDRV